MTDRTIDTLSEIADTRTFKNQFTDSFEFLLTKRQKLAIEQPSVYRADAKDQKLLKNGSRVDFSDAGFTDAANSYDLEVAAGETYRWMAREPPRYIPNNDAVISLAYQMGTSLEDGDTLVVGQGNEAFDPAIGGSPSGTGWTIVYHDSGPSITHEVISSGTRQTTLDIDEADVPALTTPVRYADQHNLYNVGSHDLSVFFTETDSDGNDIETKRALGKNAVNEDWATDAFNLQPFFELQIGSGNSTKTLECGTLVHTPLAAVSETSQINRFRRTDYSGPLESDGTVTTTFVQDQYTAFLAVRVQPADENVYTELDFTDLTPGNAGEVQARLFYADQVTFTGGDSWAAPRGLTADETVIQQRRDIASVEDANQTTQDPPQLADPGGSQIALADSDTGTAQGGKNQGTGNTVTKSAVQPDGIVVFFKINDSSDGGTDTLRVDVQEYE